MMLIQGYPCAGCAAQKPFEVSPLSRPKLQSRSITTKLFAVVVTATATLGLLTGRAAAGPPFVTDDPEPVPYQHFEFYNLSLGTAIRGDTLAKRQRGNIITALFLTANFTSLLR